jgi:hypothetical protein
VIQKDTEMISKYKDLTTETQRIWNEKKMKVTSNNSGTLGHPKSFSKYLTNIPGKHEIKELLTTAILGTTHILRNVLMLKYRTFNETRDRTLLVHSINCTYQTAAIIYTLATPFM